MSQTTYFTDDEDILVEFGQLMPLHPTEGAEALWLRAGGRIRRTTVVLGPAGYNPPPDNVKKPEKPTPSPPAKRGASFIELKCHRCGALIDAVLTQICPVL